MNDLVNGIGWLFESANWSGSDGIATRVWEHVQLSLIALALAALVAIPIGLLVGHTRRGAVLASQIANIGRAVPSLAVLGIMYLVVLEVAPRLAFGFAPTIVALVLLAFPVILINTFTGIQQVDRDTVEAARGMGMSGRQVLFRVEVPMAVPLIFTGLRLAAVLVVATAGLAALIAGGGLGRYIVDGIALRETERVVAGSILIAILAIGTDVLFTSLTKVFSPRLGSDASSPPSARTTPIHAGPS